jgi:predicted dehydrogenase
MKNLSSLWVVGSGNMAQEYSKVLFSLKKRFDIIGNKKKNALKLQKSLKKKIFIGGLNDALKKYLPPTKAIVVVNAEKLEPVTTILLNKGVKEILIEKPGALTSKAVLKLNYLAKKKKSNVFIAYNRRFYKTVESIKKISELDGGIMSMNFEFTERTRSLKFKKKNKIVKKKWLIANSSHIIDLAFFICGRPKKWASYTAGKTYWHPSSIRFSGAGITEKNILFSYYSDWQSPGQWSLEFMTKKRRLILKPLEELKQIQFKSNKISKIKINNKLDIMFKPGIFLQTKNFLKKEYSNLCHVTDHSKNIKIYEKIAKY